jgi:hypothetical protein
MGCSRSGWERAPYTRAMANHAENAIIAMPTARYITEAFATMTSAVPMRKNTIIADSTRKLTPKT